MLTDTHCHPFDLLKIFPGAEEERRTLGVMCAASASSREEFEFNEAFAAREQNAAKTLPCFALHPQLPALYSRNDSSRRDSIIADGLALLENLAEQGRLAAVGETGFDLYNEQFKATEKIQDEIFAAHVEIALRYDLPLILHARRAMHKIFAVDRVLKKCRAVVFHSWPGTVGEAQALLRRGINVYFSFGTTILLNHKEAMRCCATFPAERLLLETDAPYQPAQGQVYSTWNDLPRILQAAARLRTEAQTPGAESNELEKIVEANFRAVFSV